MKINSVAALKRFITPGMTIELVSSEFYNPTTGLVRDSSRDNLIREVKSNSSHVLVFDDGSKYGSRKEWGIARDYTIVNNWTPDDELITTGFIYDDTHRDEWGCRLVYSFPEELAKVKIES